MPRRILITLLITAIVASGGYSYYHVAYSKCRVPISYDIASIDERFGITEEEARAAISDAESLWEDATGKNLFTWKEGATALTINFEYDERQAVTEKQHQLSELLDQKAEMSESFKADYEKLRAGYESLRNEHEKRLSAYEKRLAAHNANVEEWNQKGGAPTAIYAELQRTSAALNTESAELNASAKTLNELVARINELGSKGNRAVEDYNRDVNRYNDAFGEDREFTQGDYQDGTITIYQYDDAVELRKVLAHEMGHALGIEHVDSPDAIMYYLMEGKEADGLSLHYDDIVAYRALCGSK